ncbi:MAG: N-acetylneuraminate synthase [Rhodobacteraceae bacterium]|nr:N-acetylneuraminate synthase [Paracoccaceae bacterium]MCF8515943.1 N-acetylneuraminate synthase [Paracoccaceae bacterium]MCF8520288.1 N-acetylneuraminate synthase [Paracoccaceae bacterium]
MTDHVTIIAEAGVNHNGQMDLALALIDAAAAAGADLVKFQTFRADHLAKKSAPKAAYQDRQIGEATSQHAMLKALELPYDWHAPLQAHAQSRGIGFISTAFDHESLRFLMGLDLPLFKIPSGELTNGPLLWQFARSGKPLVLSTGMATLAEVEEALAVVAHAFVHDSEPKSRSEVWQASTLPQAKAALRDRVTLLHCTSQYPTQMAEVNLRSMSTLAAAFGLPVGYSDHTDGIHVPTAAVALGARVIEKHLTTDRSLPGPDHAASLEPDEFAAMVHAIRQISTAMGPGGKGPQPSEWNTREAARQRLVAARDLTAGTVLARADLTTARAAFGVPAMELWDWVGRICPRDTAEGDGLLP